MTPADLIRDHACAAACMVATTHRARCRCTCRGELHGLVAAADVTVLTEYRRWAS